ncbi:MAG: site-specific integrase [Rhabdochlamydiaceae bacterium]|nr:site-specific integrase [Rhabdochlamydiaceae bacterium]
MFRKRPPLLHPFVVLLSTGCRYSEIRKLKWTDIDLFKGRITIRESKNGEIRSVPLCGLGLELLDKLSREANSIGYIFTYNNKNTPIDPRSSIKTAIKKARLKNFRPHDCRHSYAILCFSKKTTSKGI